MDQSRNLSIILTLNDQLSGALKTVGTQLESQKKNFEQMTKVGAVGLTAITAGAIKATNLFSEFDTEIQRAGANVGATAETLNTFREVALAASRETGVAARETANALFWLAGGSVSAEEAAASLSETIKFATANSLSLEEAARSTSAALTLFNLEGEQVTGVLDILTKSGQVSFSTMEEMSSAFLKAAPISAQLGVEISDLVTLISSLSEVGFMGEQAGVVLMRAFQELVNPTAQSIDGIQALGLTVEQLQGQLNDPIALLETLESALVDIQDPIARASALSKAFGQLSGPGLAALLSLGTESIRDMQSELSDAGGSLEDAFGRINSARAPLELLTNNIRNLNTVIGQALTENLGNLVGRISDVLFQIQTWIGENPKLFTSLVTLAAVIAGMLVTVGTLGLVIPKIIIGFQMLLSPVGLTAIAVLALVSAFVLLRESWDVISQHPVIAAVWTTLTNAWNLLLPSLQTLWASLGELWAALMRLWEVVSPLVIPILQVLAFVIGSALLGAIYSLSAGITMFTDWMSSIVQSVTYAIERISEAIRGWIHIFTLAWSELGYIWEGIKKVFQTSVDWIIENTIGKLVKNIERIISAATRARDAMANIGNKVAGGVKSAVSKLTPRVDGGPVSGGTPYMVGERGPELFVPGTSGSIVPNHSLLGGGGVTVNVYGDVSGTELVRKVEESIRRKINLDIRI
jgi:TP901 family phage tail tape measure protein